ncbi:MAG TPA: flagellar M-ring protein FliF C-terminal domain-containing protein, partial [Bacillota bacterium]|nr:flagellar M-ring protein FliF C-terminal domain-containing protein [Bacillota bacterium]
QEHTVVAPGGIKKLSVAVLVNGGNISPTQKTALTDAVSNAVGIVQSRGDQVSVSAIPFDTNYYDQIKAQMEQEAQQQRYIIYGIVAAVLIALLVVLFLWLASKRKQEELITPEGVVASDVLTVEDLIHPEPEESPEDKEREKIRQEIENLARQNPGNVAQLLKTWLTEE